MPFKNVKYHIQTPMPAFLFLMRQLKVSQSQAQRIISYGRLLVNGKPLEGSGKKISGTVVVKEFIPNSNGNRPIFTTIDFGVFDKPSGLLVHPKAHKTPYSLLDDIRFFYGKDASNIHRIDKETSGLLLASRNKKAERELKMMFESKNVKKVYHAWVRGKINKPFAVNIPLLKNKDFSTIKLKMLVDPKGKPSKTYFEPIFYSEPLDATLLKAYPVTGRQHQIRVHLFHVKHPIIGDPIYGVPVEVAKDYLDGKLTKIERKKYTGASRLMLHASELSFIYKRARYDFLSKIDFFKEQALIVPLSNRFNSLY